MGRFLSLATFLVVALTDSALGAAGLPESQLYPPIDGSRPRSSYVARSKRAMIATAHPLASAAGIEILRAGGNVIDATVAASFVISVVRPQSTGIGGGGFLLHYDAKDKKTRAYDFRERAPAAATRDMFVGPQGQSKSFRYGKVEIPDASVNGHLAVGVPGLVAGLVATHASHGRLPLAQVLRPAINIAANGFPVYPMLAARLAERAPVLSKFPATAKIFFKNGKPLPTGSLLVQKDLAKTIERIATFGAQDFYTGATAKLILAEMKRGGGLITGRDLANYKMVEREPLEVKFAGQKLVAMPPPSSGGITVLQVLNILADSPAAKSPLGSAESIHWLAESMRRAFADRAQFLGDPAFTKIPLRGLLSLDYASSLRLSIDPKKATNSGKLAPSQPDKFEHPSTTHLAIVDAEGNAVSTTQTINYYFGSGVVAAGTGVLLNDEMDDFAKRPGAANVFGLVGSDANAVAANKTPLSSMSPTLIFDDKGELRLALGSPGGPRIITATLQTIFNSLARGLDLADAVHAYRVHHQWLPDQLEVEKGGLPPKVREELKEMGHTVSEHPGMGDVEAVARQTDGLVGVSDTRSDGQPMGL
ncbi:MAG: gamma-glutamyltransferase [Pseudomonadota bacterium]